MEEREVVKKGKKGVFLVGERRKKEEREREREKSVEKERRKKL